MSRPEISLGVKPVELDSPIEGVQKALTLRSLLNQGKLQEQQQQMNKQAIDEGQLNLQKIQRGEQGQKVYTEAMKKSLTMGDDGNITIDHAGLEKQLVDAGFPEMAQAHEKQRAEAEKVALESAEKELTVASTRTKQLGQFAQSVLNAPEQDRPRLYMGALNQAVAMKLIPPDQAGQLPKEYSPEVAPLLQQMADHAASDPYAAYAARMKEVRETKEANLKNSTDQAKLDKENLDNESQLLGGSRGQDAWSEALRKLSPERQKLYPSTYSEDARKNAVFMGMTPEQRSKIDDVTSDKQLALMAAKGDKDARAALKLLNDNEISVDAAKEMNKQKALMSGGMNMNETTNTAKPDPDMLAKLPPGVASDVKMVAEYKRNITPYMLAKQPYWVNISHLAQEYDHNFDPSQYDVRMKMRNDFTNGKAATALRSLNTVAQHMNKLNESVDKLDNFGGDTVLSTGANAVVNAVTNKKAQNQVEIDRDAVANELENAYRAGGGSEQGVQAWKKNFSVNNSKDVQKNGVKEAGALVEGLIASLKNQYEKGMGKTADFNILDPKARETFRKLGVKVDEVDPEVGKKTVAPATGAKMITPELMSKARANNKGIDDETLMKAFEKKGYARPE